MNFDQHNVDEVHVHVVSVNALISILEHYRAFCWVSCNPCICSHVPRLSPMHAHHGKALPVIMHVMVDATLYMMLASTIIMLLSPAFFFHMYNIHV